MFGKAQYHRILFSFFCVVLFVIPSTAQAILAAVPSIEQSESLDEIQLHSRRSPDEIQFSSRRSSFPATATVNVEGKITTMQDLKKGDMVQVVTSMGAIKFEPVVHFLHQDLERSAEWLTIVHEYGEIKLSRKHMLFVKEDTQYVYMAADHVQEGMKLQYIDSNEMIVESRITSKAVEIPQIGVYAPLTNTGTLVVDNIHASCFSSLIVFNILGRFEHGFYNAIFKPVAWALGWSLQVKSVSNIFSDAATELSAVGDELNSYNGEDIAKIGDYLETSGIEDYQQRNGI